jgi:hypothetical protein
VTTDLHAGNAGPFGGEILIYATDDGRSRVECRFDGETIWLTQALLAELFQKDVRTINEHLKNIFADGELDPASSIREFRIDEIQAHSRGLAARISTGKQSLQDEMAATREVQRTVKHYNLQAILAVGFRVRSPRGAQFRRWASERLQEYLVKGFTMDDERLRNPPAAGLGVPDYFDELLARIRDIRASERRMYLRVQEIFAMAADYGASAADTTEFFKVMQNKLHFAATGKTAAEIIAERADHTQPNMGLTNWKGGAVRKADVGTAKNYLQQDEIDELNRIVVMWLDYAEDQARRRQQVFLRDWESKLNAFLRFNERNVLPDAGSVSNREATAKAEVEYAAFAEHRRAWLEVQGADASARALEEVAKQLPSARAAKAPKVGGKARKDRKDQV